MPTCRRRITSGGTYFFTVQLRDRGSQVLVDGVDELRAAVRQVMSERPFLIDCAVVMPDHVHMIWTLPAGDADCASRWRRIKALFSRGQAAAAQRRPREVRQGEKGLWQRRFREHMISDPDDLAAHRQWIIEAPLRAGLVERVEDWPWGSGRSLGARSAASRGKVRLRAPLTPGSDLRTA